MKRENDIGFEVRTLSNMVFRQLLTYMSRREIDEVTLMNGWIMGYLYENMDKDIFQKDIEAKFSIARSTVTGILKLMEKKGFVRRESVPQDARLKRLVLTEKGIKIHLETIEDMEFLDDYLKRDIDPNELEIFFNVIKKLKYNIENGNIMKEAQRNA